MCGTVKPGNHNVSWDRYVDSATNSFVGGLLYLSMSAFVAACLIFKLRHEHGERNTALQPPALINK